MKIPAIFSGIPPSYIIFAVLFAVVVSFGVAAISHQPLAVQVQINQYQPAPVPAPAIPTVAPVVTANPSDPFAPAPPPVVVTTAPLPTITPENTKNYSTKCNENSQSLTTMNECLLEETIAPMFQLASLLIMVGFVCIVFAYLIRI